VESQAPRRNERGSEDLEAGWILGVFLRLEKPG